MTDEREQTPTPEPEESGDESAAGTVNTPPDNQPGNGGESGRAKRERRPRVNFTGPLFEDAPAPQETPPASLPESEFEALFASGEEERTQEPASQEATSPQETPPAAEEFAEWSAEAYETADEQLEDAENGDAVVNDVLQEIDRKLETGEIAAVGADYRHSPVLRTVETRAPQRRRITAPPARRGSPVQNFITLLFIIGGIALIGYFAVLWNNPYSALNPLPPLTPPPIIITATLTPTMTFTPSPVPTDTPPPTSTPTLTPSPQPSPTPEPPPGIAAPAAENIRFTVQNNRALYLTNPETRGGCNWSSIAGTVTDAEGNALNDYRVRIIGDGVNETLITGSASGIGPGGFELRLGNAAVEALFTIQLLDPLGNAVSEPFDFRTSSLCEWNIAVLRFVENQS